MARRTISRQTYDMRRGDLVRFAGNRPRSAPVWTPTAEGIRSQEDWIRVEAGEEMTLVGRLPYRSSYEWLLRRNIPAERGRWIVAQDDSLMVLETALRMSVGRTAFFTVGYSQYLTPAIEVGDVVLITDVNALHRRRPGYQTVTGVVRDRIYRSINYHGVWVMLEAPDDYDDPDTPNFEGET
jgi:hypothetical protein